MDPASYVMTCATTFGWTLRDQRERMGVPAVRVPRLEREECRNAGERLGARQIPSHVVLCLRNLLFRLALQTCFPDELSHSGWSGMAVTLNRFSTLARLCKGYVKDMAERSCR